MKRVLLGAVLAGTTAHATSPVPVFDEIAQAAGISHRYGGPFEHFVGGGAAGLDCNGDQMTDLMIAGGAYSAAFYKNTSEAGGAISFERILPFGGSLTDVFGAYPVELNNDAHMDLAVLRNGENILLKGGPDCSFTNANAEFGFDGGDAATTGFSAIYERGAQYPTLAFGNYIDHKAPGTPFGTCSDNALYRADAMGKYKRVDLSPGYCSLSLAFTDWQGNGEFALRVANDRQYYRGGQEQLWSLESGQQPRLFNAEDGWKELIIWGMGIAEADVTGNGKPDYALSSMGDTMLQTLDEGATGPSYSDIAYARGTTATRPYVGDPVKPSTGWHTEFADFNNDARFDLFIAKGNVERMDMAALFDPDNLLICQPDGSFVEAGDKAGIALERRGRGAIVEDFNADGHLDLLVVNREEPVSLFQNTGAAGGASVGVKLDQGGANAMALGAVIEVTSDAGTMRDTVAIGGGHASGRVGYSHFGLGAADQAMILVHWPDGSTSEPMNIKAGQFATVTKTGEMSIWQP